MFEVEVGARCPGCHVVCASLDVVHGADCRYQGRNALRLVPKREHPHPSRVTVSGGKFHVTGLLPKGGV